MKRTLLRLKMMCRLQEVASTTQKKHVLQEDNGDLENGLDGVKEEK